MFCVAATEMNMLMITNQLSFILVAAEVPTDGTSSPSSREAPEESGLRFAVDCT